MSYIQNKLDEFDKLIENPESFDYNEDKELKLYLDSKDNVLFRDFEYPESQFELDPKKIRKYVEQSLTDYHNHIVEKFKEKYKFSSSTTLFEILSILQDTNPKE